MTARVFRARAIASISAILCAATLLSVGSAQPPDEPNELPVVQYQRIEIPEGRIDEIGGELLPLDRADFQSRINELNSKHRALFGSAKPNIARARYTARFENAQLVGGSAELDIKHPHSEPAYLSLTPFGLAAESFRWKNDPSREAIAGLMPTGGAGVLVTRSDTLTFDWSLQGAMAAEQTHLFQLSLPEATTSELSLSLPKGAVPKCQDAIISPLNESVATSRATAGMASWTIELGATHETQLQIFPPLDDVAANRVVMVRPTYEYRISATGLELLASLRLDLQRQPIRQLTLEVDPRLQIATMQMNGSVLTYSRRDTAYSRRDTAYSQRDTASDSAGQYVVDLPELVADGVTELTVTAFAPVVLDSPWQVPRLQIKDVLWRQGSASLDVVEPLRIGQLKWPGTALRRIEPLPAPTTGESRRFALLEPDAACELVVTRQGSRLQAQVGTTITLKESIVSAQFIAQISSSGGAAFSIPLHRDAGWIVDSIESEPAQIDHVEPLSGTRGLSREIVLLDPITPETPLRLIVKAHRRFTSAGVLTGLEMRPIHLEGDLGRSRLTAVRAELPLQLDVLGDASVTRMTEAELSTVEQDLIAADGASLVFRDDTNADRLRVALRSQLPRFNAEIVAEVLVVAASVEQSFSFQCAPMSTRIGDLRVRFSPPPQDPIQWSVVGDGAAGVSARKLDTEGNEWEISLRRPRNVPFEMRAKLSRQSNSVSEKASAQPEPIVLASLPDAETQIGTINVGTPDGSRFNLHHDGLRAIPVPIGDPERLPTLRATYRYAPAQDVTLHLTRHSQQSDPPNAWIRDADVVSRLDADGEVSHLMLLRIENIGVSHLRVDIPRDLILDRIDVDGERVAVASTATSQLVPLPPSQRFPSVQLRVRQKDAILGNYSRRTLSLPTFDLRCLNRSWRIWIPPGYESTTGNYLLDLATSESRTAGRDDWQERLFGYEIVRRAGTPWKVSSLFSLVDQAKQPTIRKERLSQVYRVLDSVDSLFNPNVDTPRLPIEWDTVIAKAGAVANEYPNQIPLYIDWEELSAAGVSPGSVLPSRATSARSALRLSNLVFVCNDRSLLLTTFAAQAAGDYGSSVEADEFIYITESNDFGGNSKFIKADEWGTITATSPHPWDGTESNQLFTPLAGWTNLRLPSESERATIVLCRSRVVDTLGWATLFVAVAAGFWLGRRNASYLYGTVFLAILCVLLVPVGFVFIARAALYGVSSAAALTGLRRRVSARSSAATPDESLSFRIVRRPESVTAGLFFLAIISAIISQRVAAQERPAADIRPPANVFRVYDPVDADGQPAGSRLFVSRAFFDSINSLETTLGTQRLGAVLTGARYSLAVPDMPMAAMLPELSIEFDVASSSTGNMAIRLPLNRDELQLIEATFDDQRVYPNWSVDGKSLELDAEIASRHKLRLAVRPVLNPQTDKTTFSLGIPAIPNSKLSITGRDVSPIEPMSALGAIMRLDDSIEADLGPTNRLSIQWPLVNKSNSRPAEFTVSQLTWVRAESRVVTIDTQFAFSILSGVLTEIELVVDPRLKLLVADDHAQVSESLTPDDTARRIRYQFNDSYEANESVTIRPSFVMTNIPEDGVVSRPLIQLASRSIDNSLLAVSASAGINAAIVRDGAWPSVQPQAFAEVWGTTQLPKNAVKLPTNEAEWSLAITPLIAQLSSADTTELRIGRQQADIRYSSLVQIDTAPIYQLELSLPSELSIDSVEVLRDDIDLVQRYSKNIDGTVTVFLSAPVQGGVTIDMNGSLPLPPRGELNYTSVRLNNSTTASHRLTILRSANVIVKVKSQASSRMQEATMPEAPSYVDERIVGVYDRVNGSADSTPDITLDIASNPARFSGQVVTTLHSEASQWSVTADISANVAQGLVDFIRVRLPRELTETLRLEPPLPFELRDVPGQSEPNLIITPPRAVDKSFQVRLHALLQTSRDGSISAPHIEVLDSPQVERLLVLPKRSAEQEVEWDIRGLEQPESDELQTTYRIRGRRMRAVVREVNQSAGNPRLLLADIEIDWRTDASYFGTASFDLEPGALTACELVIPAGLTLIHATVDDVPAVFQQVDANTVTLMLGAERLPQRIEVLFTGQASPLATKANSLTFVAPSLGGLVPLATLWSVRDPSTESCVPMLDHTIIDASATRKIRVDIIQEILGYTAGPVPQHRSNDLQHWEHRWQERLATTTANAQRESSPRLASVISLRAAGKSPRTGREEDQWTYCEFGGAAPALTVIRYQGNASDFPMRAFVAIAICVIGGLLLRVTKNDSVREFFSRWPYFPGVLIGIIWWLWLTPSVVGWLIVAVFLASSLRPIWRSRAAR